MNTFLSAEDLRMTGSAAFGAGGGDSAFLTAADLNASGTSAFHGLGADANPAGLVEKVDYYHPVGLRIKYGFTRAKYKAQIPTIKPDPGWWWVLKQLSNGYYTYEHQPKPGTTPEEAEKSFEEARAKEAAAEAAKKAAEEAVKQAVEAAKQTTDAAAVARAKTALAPAAPTKWPPWVKPVAIGAGVLAVGLVGFSLVKR